MSHEQVTLVSQAIHNPGDARHFMRIKPVKRRVRIRLGDEVLAETTAAVRLLEAGHDLYDPAFYLPAGDVTASLRQNDHSTHCPLKGDAVYFDLLGSDGSVRQEKIAWSYPKPFGFAGELAGLVAFYPDHVTFEEAPL